MPHFLKNNQQSAISSQACSGLTERRTLMAGRFPVTRAMSSPRLYRHSAAAANRVTGLPVQRDGRERSQRLFILTPGF